MKDLPKLIIFDWDGTLCRSIALIEQSIIAAGRQVDRAITPDTARHIIGLGLKAAQQLLFPGEQPSPRFLSEFHRAYREHYEAGEASLELYPGAFELVRDLKESGRIVAVATAKSRAGIDRSLQALGLAAYVAHSRTPEECRPKPDPQMLFEILTAAGLSPGEAVMVGDTTHDLQMAAAAGVSGIGLVHGAHSREMLLRERAAALCDDLHALRRLLLESRA